MARPTGPAAQKQRRGRSAAEEREPPWRTVSGKAAAGRRPLSGPPTAAQRARAGALQEVPSEARPLARAEAAAVATVHVQDAVVLELKEASTQTEILEEPTTHEVLREVAMIQSSATESAPSTASSPA